MKKSKDTVYAVIGPTASGKSAFAVNLALKLNGEIVSADSRQVYRGLDLGTGKISNQEMKGIQHYMLDVIDVNHDYSVSEYQKGALLAIEYIRERGKTAIICGGSGQYVHSILYEKKYPEVKPNPTLRKKLSKITNEKLFEMLRKKDQTRAKTIDKNNKVRLIRALEILETLPKIPKNSRAVKRFPLHIYMMDIDNPQLKQRIEKRLQMRMDAGLVDEVKELIKIVGKETDMRKYGIEYHWLTKFILGECDENYAKEKIVSESLKYAKRQITWNKKYFKGAEIIKVK